MNVNNFIQSISAGFFLLMIVSCHVSVSRTTFLNSLEKFEFSILDSTLDSYIKNMSSWSKKKINRDSIRLEWVKGVKADNKLYDSVFSDYKRLGGVDFTVCKEICIIYRASTFGGFRDFLIFSGRDTLTFREEPIFSKTEIIGKKYLYAPFMKGEEGERKLLLEWAEKKDFKMAEKYAKENPVNDGSSTIFIFGSKRDSGYVIRVYDVPPFGYGSIYMK